MTKAYEINFDGLVGPTHNYAGLATGNVASLRNKGKTSNPKAAALQGLAKMRLLFDLGIKQAVLPPHPRPDVDALRRLGFSGSDARVLSTSRDRAPALLAACASASSMWTANAATVSPSPDTHDRRLHITPANLLSHFHRSLEAPVTSRLLNAIFPDESLFAHHPALPSAWSLADEGAANHMRVANAHGDRGVEVFVYGRRAMANNEPMPKKFFARQTLEASQAIARNHGLNKCSCFLMQNSAAVDAGAFHNDVLAVANENVLLCHEKAWSEKSLAEALCRHAYSRGVDLQVIEVKSKQLELADAIRSYLFNSQLVTLPDGSMTLIAPKECLQTAGARRFLQWLPTAGTPIRSVHYVQVRQSMKNGGGPACLRLRVTVNKTQLAAIHPGVLFTPQLHEQLTMWVNKHYRDRLSPRGLADPKLLDESRRALDELTGILRLGSIYDFQRAKKKFSF